MKELEAQEQLFRWIREAQFGDYSHGASSWVRSFHLKLWKEADFTCPTAFISWPQELRANDWSGSEWDTREFLRRSREAEALARGITGVTVPMKLAEWLLIGSLAEDAVQGFVRRRTSSSDGGLLNLGVEANNDVDLVAAVASVAAVLIMVRRTQHDGEPQPAGFDHMLDSQGLADIAADIDELLTNPNYGYGEALIACHKACLKTPKSEAPGLHEFERNLWLRVLIVARNQITYVRKKLATFAYVLVEGDLDYASHDGSAEMEIHSLPRDERDTEQDSRQITLQRYCDDHNSRLRDKKGPHGVAKSCFDFMLVSPGWQNRIHLIEFKSTRLPSCPREWPNMTRYEKFLKRFASRDQGMAELRHVSSLVTPSNVICNCRPLHH
ncbi:hypothetical protein [Paractinoplanes toevensis]|uniref:Uncharacterized protein n=1 Tax=Paractinoplanes toevensis TaxID=571911 RepID=A0A920BRR9_9ACTN|nr:hypothetical protein [Actinoplanes toevensis]GIM98295.1 hypothetical protein Ato02nite_100880 [Actinoplanes toevensis]